MRILLVEDDNNLRAFLRKAFREEGYAVDQAAAGDAGLAAALDSKYDCIVLDLMLPGMGGFEIVRELRDRGLHTPVLMLTARGELTDKVKGLEGGADDYLTKPFDLAELLARVQAVIRRAQFKREDSALKLGVLKLDVAARTLTVAGRSIDLSPREFTLLEFLIRNAGRTMSRSRIAEAVWNYQFDSGTNVVDVYINYLRKKLGEVPDGTEILTVRGVGYRLEGP